MKSNNMQDLMFHLDRNGVLLECFGEPENILIMPSSEIIGKNVSEAVHPEIAQPIMQCIEKSLQTTEQSFFGYQLSVSMNNSRYELCIIFTEKDRILTILRDVSKYIEAEQQIKFLSLHDTLTNLPNRYLFKDRLEHAIANAARKNLLLSILFLDIDNFKNINDTIGYTAGDKFLEDFSDKLSRHLRQTDSISRLSTIDSDSLIARLGGDEFTILLSEVDSIQDSAKIAIRILDMLSEPFVLETHEIFVTTSIGISVYPHDGKDSDTLIRNAEAAMYKAKEQGRNNYHYYSKSLNAFSLQRFSIENKLRKALAHNEFMLFYQPQINLFTGEIIGVEALIRWLQPDLILIKPTEFIPLAEETGMITQIGEWVIRNACEQSIAWDKAGLRSILMTANVSSLQFNQPIFTERISLILKETGLNPLYLQIELTESTIMKQSEDIIKKISALRDIGIKISIDDFGTGYSSLNYLKQFPISTLKIDRSFVQDIANNADDQAITKAIIGIADNLNLNVVAEGVETREQLSYLRSIGCKGAQGYLICPPINAVSLMQFIKTNKSSAVLKSCGIKI